MTHERRKTITHTHLEGGVLHLNLPSGSDLWLPTRVRWPNGDWQDPWRAMEAAGLEIRDWSDPELTERP